jgi:hypothetical protein
MTTVMAINRAIRLNNIVSYGRFMHMISTYLVLIIGLMELVRISDYCE